MLNQISPWSIRSDNLGCATGSFHVTVYLCIFFWTIKRNMPTVSPTKFQAGESVCNTTTTPTKVCNITCPYPPPIPNYKGYSFHDTCSVQRAHASRNETARDQCPHKEPRSCLMCHTPLHPSGTRTLLPDPADIWEFFHSAEFGGASLEARLQPSVSRRMASVNHGARLWLVFTFSPWPPLRPLIPSAPW